MLVVDLGKWMNKTLINWGIDPAVADRFDETIIDRKSTRLNSSHIQKYRMPSSA